RSCSHRLATKRHARSITFAAVATARRSRPGATCSVPSSRSREIGGSMSDWSLARVLENLHSDIQNRLFVARSSFAHPGTKGDASESIWIEVLRKYLPQRYQAENAHVVDSRGVFSQQIDVVVFDRQYSPFIFNFQGQVIVPAESVYAV